VIYLDTGCLVKLYYPKPDSDSVAQDDVIEFRSTSEAAKVDRDVPIAIC
jgi:hypothetical protein